MEDYKFFYLLLPVECQFLSELTVDIKKLTSLVQYYERSNLPRLASRTRVRLQERQKDILNYYEEKLTDYASKMGDSLVRLRAVEAAFLHEEALILIDFFYLNLPLRVSDPSLLIQCNLEFQSNKAIFDHFKSYRKDICDLAGCNHESQEL